ncbi:MAG: DUF411 domain-containing protein [Alcanivoracaceae bacterium]|nr:DUF411 domain-containing protein [Alcanivoracaceae bacterium]
MTPLHTLPKKLRSLLLTLSSSAVLLILSGAAMANPEIEIFKSPSCGCCTKWADYLKDNGFDVKLKETENLNPIKMSARIPAGKGSCHTAFIDGYVIEGHVPAEDIKRLLEEKPDAQGLTVPGMPVGSPGMEMGARKDAYQVLIFQKDGTTEVFSEH